MHLALLHCLADGCFFLLVYMQNIAAAARKVNKKVKVLLRINPDVDPQVKTDRHLNLLVELELELPQCMAGNGYLLGRCIMYGNAVHVPPPFSAPYGICTPCTCEGYTSIQLVQHLHGCITSTALQKQQQQQHSLQPVKQTPHMMLSSDHHAGACICVNRPCQLKVRYPQQPHQGMHGFI